MKRADYEGMFLDDYWKAQLSNLRWDFGGWVKDITKDDKKRIVRIYVEFDKSYYERFKEVLKDYKYNLNYTPTSPYYAVQYKNGVITLFVKPQEDIYELEDYDFSNEEFLEWRRDEVYYSFCKQQIEYWDMKLRKAKDILQKLNGERSDRYDDWEVYQSELKCMESRVKTIEENVKWYMDKMKGCKNYAPAF